MSSALALQIQRLGGFTDQVLAMAHVAQLRSSRASTTPAAVKNTFLSLRIPPPSNVSEYLNRLARNRLVVRVGPSEWALTPLGLEAIRTLMLGVSDGELAAMVGWSPSEATFAEAKHHLIPPELAPAAFQKGIARFLQGHPFDRNVFGITRFPRSADDPVATAIEVSRSMCASAGLEFHIASDQSVDDLLYGNVAAAMWACRYGIAIFEDRVGEGLKYNVAIEVGGMLVTGRRCLLMRDNTIKDMPSDLGGHIYQEVDISCPSEIKDVLGQWLEDIR